MSSMHFSTIALRKTTQFKYNYSIQNSSLSSLVLRIYSSLGCLTPTITTISKTWKSVQSELKEFSRLLVSRYVIHIKKMGMIKSENKKKIKPLFYSLNLWRMLEERQALQLSTLVFWIVFWRFQIQLVKRKK